MAKQRKDHSNHHSLWCVWGDLPQKTKTKVKFCTSYSKQKLADFIY